MSWRRYAVYFCPQGELGAFGARWLGGDTPWPELVQRPQRYGFHATLKAPFVLADGCREAGLREALSALAKRQRAVTLQLELSRLGGFFALVPREESDGLGALAAACVRELDEYRAPFDSGVLAEKMSAARSERQRENLRHWGYAHVLEDFRFHLTLTGPVPKTLRDEVRAELVTRLPDLTAPVALESLSLCGEREDGRFEVIERYALT